MNFSKFSGVGPTILIPPSSIDTCCLDYDLYIHPAAIQYNILNSINNNSINNQYIHKNIININPLHANYISSSYLQNNQPIIYCNYHPASINYSPHTQYNNNNRNKIRSKL